MGKKGSEYSGLTPTPTPTGSSGCIVTDTGYSIEHKGRRKNKRKKNENT